MRFLFPIIALSSLSIAAVPTLQGNLEESDVKEYQLAPLPLEDEYFSVHLRPLRERPVDIPVTRLTELIIRAWRQANADVGSNYSDDVRPDPLEKVSGGLKLRIAPSHAYSRCFSFDITARATYLVGMSMKPDRMGNVAPAAFSIVMKTHMVEPVEVEVAVGIIARMEDPVWKT